MIIDIFRWLIPAYLGLRARWLMVFFLGVIFDLIDGGRLGLTSLYFLSIAGLVYLIKEFWPLRSSKQLHLKLKHHEES